MEKETPPGPINSYFIYQQNVHKFFDECYRSVSEYQRFMMDSQAQWLKSFEIILNPALPINPDLDEKSAKITPAKPLKIPSLVGHRKIEEIETFTTETIQSKTPSEILTIHSSSKVSSQEILPKPKKIENLLDTLKNSNSHHDGKIVKMIKLQEKKIQSFVNKHLEDLPIGKKHEIVTEGNCPNCGKLMEDSHLTHCSSVCLYEDYLKSKSVDL